MQQLQPKSEQTANFECAVCCATKKENSRSKRIACNNCNYTCCSTCQKQYGKKECMNCRIMFSSKYAMDQLGSKFVSQTSKQTLIKELMMQQKAELETIGDLVTWTQECRKIQKNLRYGLDITYRDEETNTVSKFPPKPVRKNGFGTTICACPVNDCRGTVIRNLAEMSTTNRCECTICKTAVCIECHTTMTEGAAHNCDPGIIETIKELNESTKPCPKCGTRIYKTEGCDHMHCTNCDTHFSWKHLTVLMNSSNYHYRNRLVRAATVAENDAAAATDADTDYCVVSLDDPRIPLSILQELMNEYVRMNHISINQAKDLLETLYDVTMGVRYLKRTEYSEIEIAKRVRDKYDDLQVRFAMNELTEKEWEQQVYKTHVKQQSYELIAGILHIYLANMDGIQSELYQLLRQPESESSIGEKIQQQIYEKVDRLTMVVNENIEEIRQEYDPTNMSVLKIRSVGQPDMGFCSKHPVIKQELLQQHNEADEENETPEKNIELYDYQIEHVQRLQSALKKYHFAIDLSPLGTGKTFTASKIFQEGKANSRYKYLIVIAPPSVKTKWLEVVETYKIKDATLLTYGEITGRRFSNPKCGYIIRNDYKVPVLQENGTVRMIDKYNYKTTQRYDQMVEEGVIVVMDEFQHLKNDCAQTEACETLIRAIYDKQKRDKAKETRDQTITAISNASNKNPPVGKLVKRIMRKIPKSRVLLMSGSPMDKQEQAVRLFKTLGIMQHDKIVSGFQYAGINEIVDYLNRNFDTVPGIRKNQYIQSTVNSIIRVSHDEAGNRLYRQYGSTCMRYAYNLFIEIIKPGASSTMDLSMLQQSVTVALNKYNGYFRIDEEHNIKRVNQAVAELQDIRNLQARIRMMRQRRQDPTTEGGGDDATTTAQETAAAIMRQLSRALISIETAKIATFIRLAKQELANHPTKKVVIGLNYLQTISDVVGGLSEFSPLVIDGSKTIKSRRDILAKFQAASTEHRLLIGNISVISTGIDLDDKHGDYPRMCFISPNYNTIHIYQLGHRFLRGMNTRSDTDIYMVYGQNQIERRIMESLMEKGEVMKRVTIEQSRAGVVFPSNYLSYYE